MRRIAAAIATAIALLALLPSAAVADSCVSGHANPNGGYDVQVCESEDDGCSQVYAKIDGQIGPFGALYTTQLPRCM